MKTISFRLPVLAIILLAFLFLGLTFIASGEQMGGENTGLLWINPQNASTYVGSTVNVVLQLDNITNVYGAQLELAFDPGILEVVGGQVTPGSCPQPDFVVLNDADNILGTIEYAVTQLNPTPSCNGGDVATIEFACLAEGIAPVTFDSSTISDPDGLPTSHTSQGGTVECQANVFELTGSVSLQSWANPAGTTVSVYDEFGNLVPVQGNPATVGPGGLFGFLLPISTTYSLEATHDRYLAVAASDIFTSTTGVTIDLGSAVLPTGDLNGDGVINILDISAVAGNFNKTGPVPWTP